MMAATKSMIALGFASAMFLFGNPSQPWLPMSTRGPSARDRHPVAGDILTKDIATTGKGPYARAVPPQYRQYGI